MKKILFILIAFTSTLQAQSIDGVIGGTEFTLPSGSVIFYSTSTEIYATIDNSNKAKFYNKNGGQVFGAYNYYDIAIDGDSATTKNEFFTMINALPGFSPFELCGALLYPDSLWQIVNDKYEPIYEMPFVYDYQGFKLINDSVLGVPFVGSYFLDSNVTYINGISDFTPIGGSISLGQYCGNNTTGEVFVSQTGINGVEMTYYNDSLDVIFRVGLNGVEMEGLKTYANDAAADADTSLRTYGLYKLIGDRTIYQKP
jgi:hypothetical protein